MSLSSAVGVRAEDGSHIHNCSISNFISKLPSTLHKLVDTANFSTREASGSTSQAANVAEAIEMNFEVMLVDEDLCAANFMARDGRM